MLDKKFGLDMYIQYQVSSNQYLDVKINSPIPKFLIPQFLCFVLLRKDSLLQR